MRSRRKNPSIGGRESSRNCCKSSARGRCCRSIAAATDSAQLLLVEVRGMVKRRGGGGCSTSSAYSSRVAILIPVVSVSRGHDVIVGRSVGRTTLRGGSMLG